LEYIASRDIIEPGPAGFSLAALIAPCDRGTLLDTRGNGGGIVWALTSADTGGGLTPFIHLNTPEANITPGLVVPFDEWAYCAVTVDNEAGTVLFVVNDQHETVPYTAPARRSFRGDTGHIGYKRIEQSRLTGYEGALRAMALFAGTRLTAADHAALATALRASAGDPPAVRDTAPALWLTARRPIEEQPFVVRHEPAAARRTTADDGTECLEITGDASAGVDVDPNDREAGDVVHLAFRARVDATADAVLCTVGDANSPARVAVRDGIARLESAETALELGPVADWFDVAIRSGAGLTAARVNDGTECELPHAPQATWIYLGDGFPHETASPSARILIDLASVRSRVEH
ncbi:MAG: hypothetical protein JXR94_17510, partial [Candidatus Hydrogenedentes bacterium]|nr:hypothetical protein [Candidatus Hydrogenedentota bacterium]